MRSRYQLVLLNLLEVARWDELIAPYRSCELFHSKAWMDYLAESRKIEPRFWAIHEQGRAVGFFCGGILRKGPFRILGSPLKSWGTNFLGPVSEEGLDEAEFLQALDQLAREQHLAMTELECRALNQAVLEAAHYEAVPGWTYLVRLTPEDPESMWNALDSVCRNRLRKAMRAGLTVEDADEPGVADEFYDQYLDLMKRKALVPPYPREYPRLLFRHLKKANLLWALRVRDSAGQVLATGLFPHDDRTMYFWGGASWQDGRELCPNEFLHWSAMRLAAERGLTQYDMCGYGRFKKKFGGVLTPLQRWHKCHWKSARWARQAYAAYFQRRLRIQGWWQNVRTRYRSRPERSEQPLMGFSRNAKDEA